jgi:hypothetical protein
MSARVTGPRTVRDHSHRRIELRLQVRCRRCGTLFTPTRSDARFCGPRCKVAAWRASRPRPWAVVTWTGREMRASWSYFGTRQLAERAAPADGVFSVVNIRSKPAVVLPNIDELLKRSRLECPPPEHVKAKSRYSI